MNHLPDLIQDLCIILVTAATVSILFKKLKQPVVLGYLIAGFLVGSHFAYLPSVKDTGNVTIWAEIGVIFLLFGLGLEFSFKKLTKVGKSASITAFFEIVLMLGIGSLIGKALGWSTIDSLFLGGILSISSTTIIVRAFDELGLKGQSFVSLVFGVLIVEDLIAILLLVLLSSVAVTQTLSGVALLASSVRLGFFLVLWFLLGIYILPTVLRYIRSFLSDETALIVSIGLCLSMVVVANAAGFSPALGAFVMGSLLAETKDGHRIEKLIVPVKDLFSAVFFVSVGMLIDPRVLHEDFGVIVLITVVTIVGKIFSTSIGALLSGRSLKASLQAGMSLAQIGEFSFIIATLGITLKVTNSRMYPIAVAVSAITTFTTPYLIKHSLGFFHWVDRRLPESVKALLTKYEIAMASGSEKGLRTLIWQEYGMKILFNSVILIAITLAMSRFALPYIMTLQIQQSESTLRFALCLLTLLVCGPFLWAIFIGAPVRTHRYPPEMINELQRLQLGMIFLRFGLGCLLAAFLVSNFMPILAVSGGALIIFAAVAAFLFSRYSEPIYQSIERRFIRNLTEIERFELEKRKGIPQLTPWTAAMTDFVLSIHSNLVGKSLQESKLKERFGVTIAMIQRAGQNILAPTSSEFLLPLDKIYVIGTDDQLAKVKDIIEAPALDLEDSANARFALASFVVSVSDFFARKAIRECGLREHASGLIVGVERNGTRILNPESTFHLQVDDLVWFVGDQEKFSEWRKKTSADDSRG